MRPSKETFFHSSHLCTDIDIQMDDIHTDTVDDNLRLVLRVANTVLLGASPIVQGSDTVPVLV